MKVVDKKNAKIGTVTDFTLDLDTFMIQQLIIKRPILKSFNDPELTIHRNQITAIDDYKITIKSEVEPSHIEKVKEEMYNNIDMNKWLCVSADVLYLTNYGNTIVYVMSEADWAKPVYDAFKKYVNNSNGKELIKNNSLGFEELPEVQ